MRYHRSYDIHTHQNLKAGITRPAVGVASMIYFWARLVHFVVYTAGIPVARTLAFFAGFVAQIIVALVFFGMI